MRHLWVIALFTLGAVPALAQTKPTGQDVLNQAKQAASITYGQDMTTTRGLYIGDTFACDMQILFANSNAPATFRGLRPGMIYPFQIRRLTSTNTNTSCTASKTIALW